MLWTPAEIRDLLLTSDRAAMRAICAIFRNQTDYEKSCRATVNKNGVGFCANHAKAGTELALWMTRGNHDGIMVRRVGGFTTYGGESISRTALCYEIAKHYTVQLAYEASRREMEEMDDEMARAYEDEEYGRHEREDSYYSRNSNDYHIYDTCPC